MSQVGWIFLLMAAVVALSPLSAEPPNVAASVAEATKAEQEAIDLYRFTRLLNRSLDEDGRRRMVEMMWQVVYTDRQVTEFEENLIWRAADLLGVSSRERIELRQRVANSRGEDA